MVLEDRKEYLDYWRPDKSIFDGTHGLCYQGLQGDSPKGITDGLHVKMNWTNL